MKQHQDFTQGPILPVLLRFALPVLLALLLQAMYGAVDLQVVGRFGTAADISAVSTGSQIMHTVTTVITGLAMGVTVLLGQKIGEGNRTEAGAVVGGGICVIGQLLIDLTGLTPARILTGYVVAGVILSAVGWYAPLAEFAGCGATVPLLGFGHLLAKGVRTAIEEEGAIGILTGGLIAAAAGITTSLVCGVVCSWVGRSHDQN